MSMNNEAGFGIHSTANFIIFRDSTDFSSGTPATAAYDIGIPSSERVTYVDMDLTSLAASGGARESDKFDFGATRAPYYRVDAVIEFATATVDSETVAMYLGGSNNATAGNGNPAKLTGVDAAYTEADGLLAQLQSAGSLTLDADAAGDFMAIGRVGILVPEHRYGILVVENEAADAFAASMDETYIMLTPLTWGN